LYSFRSPKGDLLSTHDITANGNGVVAANADPLAPIIAELETQLAPLAARRSQLESEIADLLSQERRIKAGITALSAGPAKAKKPTPGKKDTHDWTPSQKTLDDVYAVLVKAPDGLTLAQLDEALDVSRATISKAVDTLRQQERVRLMGRAASPGAPKLFGVMP
jgi:hypothetical protein